MHCSFKHKIESRLPPGGPAFKPRGRWQVARLTGCADLDGTWGLLVRFETPEKKKQPDPFQIELAGERTQSRVGSTRS